MHRRLAVLVVLALTLVLSSCLSGGGGGGGDSDASYSIAISASPASIVADGSSSATINVTVTNGNGIAVAYESVTLSSSRGTLSTTSINTNSNGSVQVTLRSSTSAGAATVTARAGGASNSMQVQFVAGPAEQITDLAANPSSPAPGEATAIQARVRDAFGNPVSGVQVTFTLIQNQSGSSFTSAQTETGGSGLATVSYTPGPASGTDILSITAEGASAEEQLVLNIGPGSSTTPASITLSASPASLKADGSSTAAIMAVVRNSAGIALPNVQVALSSSLGTLSSTSATTNSAGTIQVSLRSGTTAGTATVVAQAGGVSNSLQVEFTAGSPARLTDIGSNPGTPSPGSTVLLQARVCDAFGNPVSGVQVTFTLIQNQSGSGFTSGQDASDSSGMVLVSYTAGTASGVDILRITAPGIATESQLVLNIAPVDNAPASISLSADPGSITADGNSTAVIVATVRNSSGATLPNVQVALSASLGTISLTSAATNSTGAIQATLRSGTFAGSATVIAQAGSISNSIQVEFTAGPAAQITDIGSNPASPTPGSTAMLQARVRDANGNPVSGVQLTFTLIQNQSGSSFTSAQEDSDSTGMALVSYMAGPNNGIDILRVTAEGVATEAQLVLNIGPGGNTTPASITLSADPASITADGISTAAVSATVLNSSGIAIPDVLVSLSASLGTLSSTSATTNSGGRVQVSLKSGTTAGAATVIAQAGGVSNNIQVEFTAGPAAQITGLGSNPPDPEPGETLLLQARVQDASGNPVPGAEVSFSSIQNQSGSEFTEEQATTGNGGLASVQYEAGPDSGTDILRVSVQGTSIEAQLVLNIIPGNLTPASIEISSNPASIQVEGSTSATVTATVRNAQGQGLPDIQVDMSTTLGQILGTGAHRAAGFTDNTGQATFILQAGTVSGKANLTAQTGALGNSLLVDILPGAPAGIGSLSASPASPGANSQAMLQARVTDQYGNPISGVEVTFQLIQNQSGADFTSSGAATGAGGWATLGYTTGPNIGIDIFRVSTQTLVSEENLHIQLTPNTQTVGSMELTIVGDSAIPADGSSSTILEALVLDLYGDPIPGAAINFSQSMGTLTATSALTNAEGKARVSLISGTAPGEVTVTASSGILSDLVTVWFVSTMTEIGSIDLEIIGPATIPADGSSSTAFGVTVLDSSGDPLEGVTVNLSADSGALSSSLVKTNSEGKAQASLISSPWPGLVAIVAEADGVTDSAYVTFEEVQQYNAGGISIEILGETAILADGISSTAIEATVVDSGGNPLSQAVVYFSTTLGTVSEGYKLTNAEGKCQVSLKSATTGGQAVVQAVAGSYSDSAYVTFLQAHAINVYCVNDEDEIVENPSVDADGTSSIRVRALVQDTFAEPLPNVVVSFSSSDALLGVVTPGQAATNDEGIAQVSVIGMSEGTVKITGSIGGLTDSVYIVVD